MNLRQATHKRPKKKKEARISSSDDDEVDFLPVIAGAAILGGAYSAYKGSQAQGNAGQQYDIKALRREQSGIGDMWDNISQQGQGSINFGNQMYGQGRGLVTDAQGLMDRGEGLLDTGESFFDIGSEQNQLMRKGIQGQSMDAIALQHTMAQRGPNTNSGIARQNLAANQLTGARDAQKSFLEGYQNNMGIGVGVMGQGANVIGQGNSLMSSALGHQQAGMQTRAGGIGQMAGAAQGHQGLAENIQQAMIGNTDVSNQNAQNQANYWGGLSSGLFSMGGNMIGGMGGS